MRDVSLVNSSANVNVVETICAMDLTEPNGRRSLHFFCHLWARRIGPRCWPMREIMNAIFYLRLRLSIHMVPDWFRGRRPRSIDGSCVFVKNSSFRRTLPQSMLGSVPVINTFAP